MKPLYSIGVVGAGMYGKVLMGALGTDRRARLSWVCSASEATSRSAAAEFGVPRWTMDYRELLADPSLDAVVIATPPYLHAEVLEAAVAAGKHVLLEKPMAASRADVARILASARSHPELVVLEASCRHTRLQPKYEFVRKLIQSGRLGEVYHIHHVCLGRGTFVEWNKRGAWALNRKFAGGGPLIDWGVYDLSFHLGLLGDVPRLKDLKRFSKTGLRDMSHLAPVCDVEQHGAAWLEFDGGLSYYYERGAGVHGETSCETRIHGTKAGLRLQYPSWDSNQVELFYADEQPQKETLHVDLSGAKDDNLTLALHFLDCLDGRCQPLMTPERAAKHMDILFRILGE